MFYDDILCSFTNSFYSPSNNYEESTLKSIEDIECLYILGIHYRKPINEIDLIKDVSTRFWFTYRRGFNNIGGVNGPDTDQGWGCMIRCGQMLLAECFSRIYLKRDYRWECKTKNNFYWSILNYFKDEKLASYSIHQIASMGASSENIPIGKWFGPNAIVQVLNKLSLFDDSTHLKFYIAMDNCVYIDDIYETMKNCNKLFKCDKHKKSNKFVWDPLLLILPLRLGLNEFNEEYKESIKRCFELKQIIGMIGGKPNSAYYFYGYADDSLLYLDPHEVQNFEQNLINEMKDETYHTKTFWKLKFANLDPSVAIAFLCENESDFQLLIKSLRDYVLKPSAHMNLLFEIFDKKPSYNIKDIDFDNSNKSEDEYVLL